MVDIVIQGDDQDLVARKMTAAIREIFAVDPLTSTRGGSARPGTRSLEALLLVLAIPPAVAAAQDVVKRWEVHERWNRLIGRAEAASKDNKATIKIDIGDGKTIPLHAANRDQILEALKTLETHLKS